MRLILHIGQHKTGSKALQAALFANRDHLGSHGIAYPIEGLSDPRSQLRGHHRLFRAVRAAAERACCSDEASGRDPLGTLHAPMETVASALQPLIAHAQPGMSTVVISAEDLFDMHTAHERSFSIDKVAAGARILADALAGQFAAITIVCYLRRQDRLLAAHYAQLIKGGDTNHPTFDEFTREFWPRLESHSILGCWERAFGAGSICVAAYEPQSMGNGIVADFFARALQAPIPPVSSPFPDDLETRNITPARPHIEFMRCMNRRASKGLHNLPRRYALEAAFRDPHGQAAGVAEWLSPCQRTDMLAAFEEGNLSIASRFGIGTCLFREPLPSESRDWIPAGPLGLARLVSLDSATRALADDSLVVRGRLSIIRTLLRRSRSARRMRRVLIVAGPLTRPEDEQIAAEIASGVAGSRDVALALESGIALFDTMRPWHRTSLIMLVGAATGPRGPVTCALLRMRALHGTSVLQVLGGIPADAERIKTLTDSARVVDALVCGDLETARGIVAAVPELSRSTLLTVHDGSHEPFLIAENFVWHRAGALSGQ